MRIILNGRVTETHCTTLHSLRDSLYSPDAITIYEGFQTNEDMPLREGCHISISKPGVMPPQEEMEALMSARHTPGLYQRLKRARVAIAGLGGLGSNIAIMLARSGVGELLLVDYDLVEPTNLNRQQYFINQLGMYKTQALKETLKQVNPYIQVYTANIKVEEGNLPGLFADYPLVCEAFDNPDSKAMLVNYLLTNQPDTYIVAASGMAGIESSNSIHTTRSLSRLYICGDLTTAADYGMGLMAPRATICAAHQANMILRIIDEKYEP